MRLFLDTTVLVAAAGSAVGASRFVILEASAQGWTLVTTDYCAEEAHRNVHKLGSSAVTAMRNTIVPRVEITEVCVTLDKPLVFPKAKDRPVVISALIRDCEWLLTLDETDFHGNLGRSVYGMRIASPGEFLRELRHKGLL